MLYALTGETDRPGLMISEIRNSYAMRYCVVGG
jgi:hypothetical protein